MSHENEDQPKKMKSERAIGDKCEESLLMSLQASAADRQAAMIQKISELVSIESPSSNKAAVDRVVSLVAGWCESERGRVKLHRQSEFGDLLEASFGPRRTSSTPPLLLLGHLDTVWEMGTIHGMPYRKESNRISGPGVLDMKAGVAMGLTAIQILRELKALNRQVKLLLHSDEEIGSPVSRAVTENVARHCGAVYVLEPAQGPQGAYKTARKGVGRYRLEVSGVAAHSGVDFSAGHSAILELARQIERIGSLTNSSTGITVNPGVIGGGTLCNVVAANAWADIDVRTPTQRDAARVDRALRGLRAVDKGCKLRISGGVNRPPMERTKGTAALFRRAQHLASAMGFALEEASTGGGSDGNFTSALGIPTLDGAGAVGAGAHAAHEHILVEYLAPRTALLAAMMLPA
jgi:glutamate carboxypeptidase